MKTQMTNWMMKAKMMDLVISCVEIYLGSSSCPSFLVFLDVHDRCRLGHLEVRQEVVLVERWDLPECFHHLHPMKVPSWKVEDCWMELHTQAVMHWEVPHLGHKILLVLEFPPEVGNSRG